MEFNKMARSVNTEINRRKMDGFKFQDLTENELKDIYERKKDSRAREILELKGLNGIEIEYLNDFIWAWIRLQRRLNIVI